MNDFNFSGNFTSGALCSQTSAAEFRAFCSQMDTQMTIAIIIIAAGLLSRLLFKILIRIFPTNMFVNEYKDSPLFDLLIFIGLSFIFVFKVFGV